MKVKKAVLRIYYVVRFLLLPVLGSTQMDSKIVVDAEGNGNYKTIQDAVNSLPDSSSSLRTIFIKKGTYKEKLFVVKSNLVFEGEEREKTIITVAIARDEWRCEHADDWGVATLNVSGKDITLKNLTVINSYGFDHKEPVTIYCAGDTTNKQKQIRRDGHQMALRVMNGGTRLKAINCRFSAFGGDTVSPWDVENGMWYFKGCIMEGGVDFYCPRGWAWAENCEFNALTGPAAIWHDGSKHEDSKTVLLNCRFKGYDGFLLGRYHRDAQFYLINCAFADNMRDSVIYRVPTNNVIQWGSRVYYFNCHRKAGDYKWFADNISKEQANKINVQWVFDDKWKLAE